MKFVFNVQGFKSVSEEYGGGHAQLFLKVSIQAPSLKFARQKVRSVFCQIHPSSRSRFHTETCRVKKVFLVKNTRTKLRKFKVLSVQSASNILSSAWMGSVSRDEEEKIDSPKLKWEKIKYRNT